jgi:hypothetical protein
MPTAAYALIPARYWRSMDQARPVRVPRILAFLLLWWLVIRAVLAVPLAIIGGANGLMMTPGIGYGAYFANLTPGWFADHYARSVLGFMGPTVLGGWSQVTDAPVHLGYGLFPAHIGVVMAAACVVASAKSLVKRPIAPDLVRAWLMGLLILAPVYEGTRIITAIPDRSAGYWNSFFILVLLIVAGCAWHQAWWVSASQRLTRLSRTTSIMISFCALAASIPIHLILLFALESWL